LFTRGFRENSIMLSVSRRQRATTWRGQQDTEHLASCPLGCSRGLSMSGDQVVACVPSYSLYGHEGLARTIGSKTVTWIEPITRKMRKQTARRSLQQPTVGPYRKRNMVRQHPYTCRAPTRTNHRDTSISRNQTQSLPRYPPP